DHRGEGRRLLPGEGLELQRVQRDPLPGLGRLDQQARAVAGPDDAHPDLGELVAQGQGLADPARAQGRQLLRGRPCALPVLELALPSQAHKKTARFWVRSTDSSTVMWRRASRHSPPTSRSTSRRPAETRDGPSTSPRLRNSSTADSTRISPGTSVANVRTLDRWWRSREGGSSVPACPVRSRATRRSRE